MPDTRLVDVLNLIAAPFDEQVRALPDFVTVSDELALLFDDELGRLRSAGIIDEIVPPARSILEELDVRLEAMSGNREHWTSEALKDSEEWRQIREMACAALEAMGEDRKPPIVDWVTFTQ